MIQINDKLRIVPLDKYNLSLEENRTIVDKNTQSERQEWCWVGYYSDLKSAIGGALKHFSFNLAEEEIVGWQSVIEKLDEIKLELQGAIK
jgi:hypothetical protein